jgi:hypothetical protein
MSERDRRETRYEPEPRRDTGRDRQEQPRSRREEQPASSGRDRRDEYEPERRSERDRQPERAREPEPARRREPERQPVRTPGSKHGHERKDLGSYRKGDEIPGNVKKNGDPDMRDTANRQAFLKEPKEERQRRTAENLAGKGKNRDRDREPEHDEYEPEPRPSRAPDRRDEPNPVEAAMEIKRVMKKSLPMVLDRDIKLVLEDIEIICESEARARGFEEEPEPEEFEEFDDREAEEPEPRERPRQDDRDPPRREESRREDSRREPETRRDDPPRRSDPDSRRPGRVRD